MSDAAGGKPVLLVLASTYPRWAGDPEPAFVHELARRLTGEFAVVALVPGAPGARDRETLDGVEVIRFRYAPRRLQTLVNDGGILGNLTRSRWKWLLVPSFVVAQAWCAWRIARRRRVAVVHAHWLLPQGLIAAALGLVMRRPPPFLVTSHGADLFALRGPLLARAKRWVAARAAAITVVSRAMRDTLVDAGTAADRIDVQPMGVDLEHRFTPDAGCERAEADILFVGRLVEKKGLRHLIDALTQIRSDHPGARLLVAGFGPEEAERRQQVARLGLDAHVHFLGAVPQSELPALYRRAAVFVAPFVQARSGDREGLGLVVVEAAGCGCPLVVGDVPAVADVVGADLPATVVAADSPPALAAAISSVLRTAPRPDASQLARLRERFDWNAVAARYRRLLAGIAAG
jgi:glycosyltransferase involved in cell wall biosynthesis